MDSGAERRSDGLAVVCGQARNGGDAFVTRGTALADAARLPMRGEERPRVLIVDDDQHILGFLGLALEDEGYDVATAPNGAVALERVAERAPALIILDLWMPVMDGWRFLRAYRERAEPQAPVIALTAAQYDASRQTLTEADAFLTKPFSLDELIDLVRALARTGGEAEVRTAAG